MRLCWLLGIGLLAGCSGLSVQQRQLHGADDARAAGRLGEALQVYWRVLRDDPESSQALAGVARVAETQARWQRASELYADWLQVEPENLRANLGWLRCTAQARGAEAALALLPTARDRTDEPAALWALQARLELAAGRPAQARAACQQALSLEDEWLDLHFLMARIEVALGNPRAAQPFAATAAALSSEAAQLHGELLLALERYPDACKAFEQALPGTDSPGEVWLALGRARAAAGKPKECLTAFWQAEAYGQDPEQWRESALAALESLRHELPEYARPSSAQEAP